MRNALLSLAILVTASLACNATSPSVTPPAEATVAPALPPTVTPTPAYDVVTIPETVPWELRVFFDPQASAFFYEEGTFEYGKYKDPNFMGLWYETSTTRKDGWYILRLMSEDTYALRWIHDEVDGKEQVVFEVVFNAGECKVLEKVEFLVRIEPVGENLFHYWIGPCSPNGPVG